MLLCVSSFVCIPHLRIQLFTEMETATDKDTACERRQQIPLLALSLKHADNGAQEYIPADLLPTGTGCDAAKAKFLGSTVKNSFQRKCTDCFPRLCPEKDSKMPPSMAMVQKDIIQTGRRVVYSIIQDFTHTKATFWSKGCLPSFSHGLKPLTLLFYRRNFGIQRAISVADSLRITTVKKKKNIVPVAGYALEIRASWLQRSALSEITCATQSHLVSQCLGFPFIKNTELHCSKSKRCYKDKHIKKVYRSQVLFVQELLR